MKEKEFKKMQIKPLKRNKLRYLIETIIGLIITSPISDEILKTVLNYDNSMFLIKIALLFLLQIIHIIGYIILIDGIIRLFLDISIKEIVENLKKTN